MSLRIIAGLIFTGNRGGQTFVIHVPGVMTNTYSQGFGLYKCVVMSVCIWGVTAAGIISRSVRR